MLAIILFGNVVKKYQQLTELDKYIRLFSSVFKIRFVLFLNDLRFQADIQ